MDTEIYLEKRDVEDYPKNNVYFHPSIKYPEYLFSNNEISPKQNEVYDMVRETLCGLKLDIKNFGTAEWNPLGDLIKPGDCVVVKPNMVKHYDTMERYECTLTHPSVVRAVLDYCIIAKPGKIILGDAPIQGADMGKIKQDYFYNKILDLYKQRNIPIEFVDFRDLIVESVHGIIKPIKNSVANSEDHVRIDIGKDSKHYNPDFKTKYGICGYTDETINRNHNQTKHEYVISKHILEADVIINLPKPKTHRFAGITGAQKNFVGVCSDKESLPHFKVGGGCVGGDETNKDTLASKFIAAVYRKYLQKCKEEKYRIAKIYQFAYSMGTMATNKTLFIQGAWYGNDTIWRTIIDLNKIVFYAKKSGVIDYSRQQRKVLVIGDMIIAGEKKGPLDPEPKKLGCILGSLNCALFDTVFCKMTGFNEQFIPTVSQCRKEELLCPEDWENVKLNSNIVNIDGTILKDLKFPKNYFFEPHPYWKEVL